MALDISTDIILENDKVLLRPLGLADLPHLLRFSEDEPELWKYSLQSGSGKENLKKYLEIAEEGKVTGREYPFIVFDKVNHEYAGSTRFYDIQPTYQTVQLGYTWYGKKYQGTGLNKNCKFLLLQLAFEQWEVARVEFRADNRNEKSIAAMKSIGCKAEGLLRSNYPNRDGTRRDSIILSILKDEWHNEVKSLLESKIKSV